VAGGAAVGPASAIETNKHTQLSTAMIGSQLSRTAVSGRVQRGVDDGVIGGS
jgi:hypothetical protein